MSLYLLKAFLQYLIPQKGLTALAGFLAELKITKVKNYLIQRFIAKYQVNMREALIEEATAYPSFNNFFIRHLKPGSRPLAQAGVISPVDACVSEIGTIEEGQLIQAKGHYYSVTDFLACNKETADQFINGYFITLYLSPKDYHRVHMPMDAELSHMTYIPGALFSVKPSTVRVVSRLFTRNERLVIFFSTKVGPMAIVMVGATIVGTIGTSWHGDIKRSKKRLDFDYSQADMTKFMAQGEEIGYFKLGSTVVLLFANQSKIQWDKSLKAGSVLRFGEVLGEIA